MPARGGSIATLRDRQGSRPLPAHHPLLMEGTGPDDVEHGGAGSLWLRRVS